jgi:hypothetical protein
MILREQANFEKKLLTFFNFFMFLLTVGRSFLKVSQISLFLHQPFAGMEKLENITD